MKKTNLSFDELMKAVLEQLKFQNYTDSTLILYRRIYDRINIFMQQRRIEIYTQEIGKLFLKELNVSKSTFTSY